MPEAAKNRFAQPYAILSDCVRINAPRELVWEILTDLKQYPAWNPFTYKVESTLSIGDPVDLTVKMGMLGNKQQREIVCTVKKPEQLSWNMKLGMPWLLQAQRDQFLLEVDSNTCTYQTSDTFSGLLTPLVLALYESQIKKGFNSVAYALKIRAEALLLK